MQLAGRSLFSKTIFEKRPLVLCVILRRVLAETAMFLIYIMQAITVLFNIWDFFSSSLSMLTYCMHFCYLIRSYLVATVLVSFSTFVALLLRGRSYFNYIVCEFFCSSAVDGFLILLRPLSSH